MNRIESLTLDDKYKASLRSVNSLKRKERCSKKQSSNNVMSTTTRDFIQKICYRMPASKDMTQYGFISDSKLHPVNLLMKPLMAQLEKICGKPSMNGSIRRNLLTRKKGNSGRSSLQTMQEKVPALRRVQQHAGSPSVGTPSTSISAPSTNRSHSSSSRVRKVTIYEPRTRKKKKVTLVLPGAKDKKK